MNDLDSLKQEIGAIVSVAVDDIRRRRRKRSANGQSFISEQARSIAEDPQEHNLSLNSPHPDRSLAGESKTALAKLLPSKSTRHHSRFFDQSIKQTASSKPYHQSSTPSPPQSPGLYRDLNKIKHLPYSHPNESMVALNYSTVLIGIFIVVPTLAAYNYVSEEWFLIAGEILVGGVCTIAILSVVFYHLTTTPHPKFTMNPRRKWCLRIHVIAGSCEVLASLAAIVLKGLWNEDTTVLGRVQAAMAFVNAFTAFFQTPIVFGAKGIMVPGYYYVELLHCFFAWKSWWEPNTMKAILKTFYCVNIFTFVRVYIKMMFYHNVGHGHTYSVASILATVTMLPFLLGPASVFAFMLIVHLNGELVRRILGVDAYHPEYLSLIHEHDRYKLFDQEAHAKWQGSHDPMYSRQRAKEMFDSIDTDGNGTLGYDEILDLFKKLDVSKPVTEALIKLLHVKHGHFDFEDFFKYIWNMRTFKKPTAKLSTIKSSLEKARFIFDGIDTDGNGVIDVIELTQVLVEWGCPGEEIKDYISYFDGDGNGVISFEEFLMNMQDLWMFGFELQLLQEAIDSQETTELVKYASEHDLTDLDLQELEIPDLVSPYPGESDDNK